MNTTIRMNVAVLVALSLLCLLSTGFRIDTSLHGSWRKQRNPVYRTDSDMRPPIEYDDFTISSTSISDYGECHQKVGHDSFIFGLKRMGKSDCFRCLTLISRTPNVLQAAHQSEDHCYSSVSEAKKTCFVSKRMTQNEGYFWFRSEGRSLTNCPLEGRFDVGYMLKGSDLRCELGKGTTAETCQKASQATFHFENCTFPGFEMTLACLGSWAGPANDEYVIFENLESAEFRCALLNRHRDQTITVSLSVDSSCHQLSSGAAPIELYTFKPALRSLFAPCEFPEWLLGEYTTMSISIDQLEYSQKAGETVPVISRCVALHGERIMVYSETKCGDKLGFHCLWFRPRSPSVVEFKTTLPADAHNASLCDDDALFSDNPWTAAAVKHPIPAPCGFTGKYITPPVDRHSDCYNLSIDCRDQSTMRLTAFHCGSGVVFDARSYTCVASWRERGQLFTFVQERLHRDNYVCFISEYSSSSLLMLTSTGAFCPRDFNFTNSLDRTILLEEEKDCTAPSTSSSTRAPSTTAYNPPSAAFRPRGAQTSASSSSSSSSSSSFSSSSATAFNRFASSSFPPLTANKQPAFFYSTSTPRTTTVYGTHWKWGPIDDGSNGGDVIDTLGSSSASCCPLFLLYLTILIVLLHRL